MYLPLYPLLCRHSRFFHIIIYLGTLMSPLQVRKFEFVQVHSCRNGLWAYLPEHCSAVVLSAPGVVSGLLCGALLHTEIIASPHFLHIENIPATVTIKHSSRHFKSDLQWDHCILYWEPPELSPPILSFCSASVTLFCQQEREREAGVIRKMGG